MATEIQHEIIGQYGQTAINTNNSAYYPQQNAIVTPPQNNQCLTDLKTPKLHTSFGIVHIVLGTIMFTLEIAGLTLNTKGYIYYTPAVGIWCGLFLWVTGILQLCAGLKNYRCCLIAALVMDIITACLLFSGTFSTFVEPITRKIGPWGIDGDGNLKNYHDIKVPGNSYNIAKAGINSIICHITFVTVIVHSGFGCYESCCRKHQTPYLRLEGCQNPIAAAPAYFNPQLGYPSQQLPETQLGMQEYPNTGQRQPQLNYNQPADPNALSKNQSLNQ